jgi:hypothetical protein
MKQLYLFSVLAFSCLSFSLSAQLTILFVDDSGDNYMNSEFLQTSLDQAGFTHTVYDAFGQGVTPDQATMDAYDLVIWHTSSSSGGLQLWEGNDIINTQLTGYLDNGGNLWLIGNDFLFDRYGGPTVAFTAGDFEYDYIGIESFDVESYISDGEVGVSYMEPAMGQPIPGLENITFQFPTLWYADGVTPRAETVPIYVMGDPDYDFYNVPTGVWYDNGTSIVLTYFFDLALSETQQVATDNVEAVLGFFETAVMTQTEEVNLPVNNLRLAPVPATDYLELNYSLEAGTQTEIILTDLLGRKLATILPNQDQPAGAQSVVWSIPGAMSNGMYLVQIRTKQGIVTEKLEILR